MQKSSEKGITPDFSGGPKLEEILNESDQVLFFEYLGGGDYMICFKMFSSGMHAMGTDTHGKMTLSSWKGGDNQRWKVEEQDTGYLKVTHKATGNVLSSSGTKVIVEPWSGSDDQLWSHCVLLGIDRSKAYHTITWPMAHDSHTDKETSNYHGIPGHPSWEDQTQDVRRQLVGGIRVVRISTGLYAGITNGGTVRLVHTIVLKEFSDYLNRMRDFLDAHPQELVTIYDEGDAGKSDGTNTQLENDLATQYAATFGGDASAPKRVFVPGQGGMPTLDEIKANGWPTVQQMLDAGIQVIVFMKNDFPMVTDNNGVLKHPWILPSPRFFTSNPYDNKMAVNDYKTRPACVDVTASPATGLFKFNHFFYVPFGDKYEQSSRAYNIWTVGDLLVEDALRAWVVNGFPPNFVNVDFYQGVEGARSHLTTLVRAINSSTSAADLEQRLKGLYLQNTSVQIGYPYAAGANQPRYQLVNAQAGPDGTRYALSVSSISFPPKGPPQMLAKAALSPSNPTDPIQQWFLRFNAPGSGVQLHTMSENRCFVLLQRWAQPFVPDFNLGYYLDKDCDAIGDAGWEFSPNSDGTYTLRKSGDSTRVLGPIRSFGPGEAVGMVAANPKDRSQCWEVVTLNTVPYPGFLPANR